MINNPVIVISSQSSDISFDYMNFTKTRVTIGANTVSKSDALIALLCSLAGITQKQFVGASLHTVPIEYTDDTFCTVYTNAGTTSKDNAVSGYRFHGDGWRELPMNTSSYAASATEGYVYDIIYRQNQSYPQ